jgi:signal transduction histidine kinase/phage shock protein PspC (stress-responsive transcriptional regulator)
MVGGVCAGLARYLGVDPIVPRVGMVVLTIGTSGFGILAYIAAWAFMPAGPAGAPPAPRRGGKRRRRGSWRIAAGIALLALSVMLVFRELGVWWSDALIWPLVLATFGVALLWSLTRSPAEVEEPPSGYAGYSLTSEAPPRQRAGRLGLAGFGVALIAGAGLLFLLANGDGAGNAALSALVVAIAILLISTPLWWGLLRRLTVERSARIRSEERADLAAHLHDSVLQTLALVQRKAGEPGEVAKLARRQERELRQWLSGGDEAKPTERLADALRAAAAEVEESHDAIVEAVVVGDAPLDPHMDALVGATREALTNAAKFAADGGEIRLYAEIENGEAKVFVDDRGPGFDPSKVPGDRRGVRESIIGRMERHGGHAEIRSEPGRGTEIELAMQGERP